ncbi:MAG: DUF6273 domain-containing protein [Eubacterium sp.]|nr:DUF6273 domain-containing protein [Eubacterium sp.]
MKRITKGGRVLTIALAAFLTVSLAQSGSASVKAEASEGTDYGISNPRVTFNYRDTITFGSYWQEDTNGDGTADKNDSKTPITWQILEKYSDGTALVMSDKILDGKECNDNNITWEESSIRNWLGNEFYNDAFSQEEKSAVIESDRNSTKDKVFLLTLNDMTNTLYKFDKGGYASDQARTAKPTAYAKKNLRDSVDGTGWWWVKSTGNNSFNATLISDYGSIYDGGGSIESDSAGVRPALRINLSSPYVKQNEKVKVSVRGCEWDTVIFGKFEGEEIAWRVLNVDGDEAFLLSDKVHETKREYNDENGNNTWKECTLRTWLNGYFYNNAFSDDERSMIKEKNVINNDNEFYGSSGGDNTIDKIYLLSLDEIKNNSYGFPELYQVESQTRMAEDLDDVAVYWWLRSPGRSAEYVSIVYADGTISFYGQGNNFDNDVEGVRPVLHIDLSSSAWKKGEPVKAGDTTEDNTEPTPTPAPITESTEKPTTAPTTTPSSDEVTKPTKVIINTAKNVKKNRLTLKWKKIKDAKGYQVQYALNKKFTKSKKTKTTTKISYTIKKLKKKKTYYVRVRAYTKDSSGKKVYGKWSKVKKVKIKK